MTADTLEELHVMAETLAMRRSWFQEHATLPHYDLVPSKRTWALREGAVFKSGRDQARERIKARGEG